MSGIIGVSPDMRSGIIGAWPKGHVIQTVRSVYQTNNDHSNSSTYDNSGTLTITPKRADSSLWMQFSCIVYTEGGTNNMTKVGISTTADGTGTAVGWSGGVYNVEKRIGSVSEIGEVTVPGYVASSATTTARSYYLIFTCGTNTQNVNLSTTNGLLLEYMP